ncbi:type III restriction-modification system endonuclease [Phascolarctobacterium succinatutens]|uniref:type III restriction-modification system endonuclease n=1 Tax=Phascolarctobacterium succinatutens TaxID=626940 RepID=UPI004028B1D8
MKFSFKIQQYQTDAVNAVVDVFKGQVRPAQDTSYFFDPGRLVPVKTKKAKNSNGYNLFQQELDEQEAKQDIILGYANAPIKLDKVQLLENIKLIQGNNNITPSKELIEGQGKCSLDIEMETGTGKTYVYIKTMFELNRQYGWNKFIIIVPSVAIREGVKKSLETMEEHFMSQYGRKARYFIYDSKNLTKIDDFAKSNEINVMIINNQAFAKSLNEEKNKEGRGGDKGALIIYSERDEFGSRKPIDVIAKTNPILILDEPQKLNGPATQKAMKRFNPLFSVNYSATHKQEHNEVYRLDAIDAYNHKLVKKIEVKGIEVVNLKGIDGYLYCDSFVTSKNKPPMVKLEFEQQLKSGTVKRVLRNCAYGDNLYELSNGMLQYEGYKISDIDASDTGCVRFTNGEELHGGEVVNNSQEMSDLRRVQIRETIKSHFEKEEQLFAQGIKTLSLFFIDEVAKYRQYDEDGTQKLGEYGKIFEEEYHKIFRDRMQELYQTPYGEYLRNMAADVSAVHTGYFSIDKKGHSVDSKCERGKDTSNDESAYDLIMRHKEALLSFNNPVRFIFSHSALREGWDNPNVFQICTLKQSNSNVNKRQEVGRGMRICVNQQGERMDESVCGANVHVVNKLTVIASESYAGFVDSLQDEIKKALYERPEKVSIEYFFGRGDETYKIEGEQARQIVKYLDRHDYLDDDDRITEKYKQAAANGTLEPVQDKLKAIEPAVHVLIKSLYDKDSLKDMITNGNQTTVENKLNNKNFEKQEFQELWKRINRKCAYTVKIDSNVLIDKAVAAIDAKLQVTQTLYTLSVGYQKNNMQAHELEQKTSFVSPSHTTNVLKNAHDSSLKYDLLHELTQRTSLTRRTVAAILSRINMMKYRKFRDNPEEFISKVARLINEQKAGLIVEGVTYNTTNEVFDKEIFTAECHRVALSKVFPALRAVTDYVVTDGIAEQSVERRFVENLDKADEVAVYAKLPRGFYIPTPVGKYSPDWAIAFKEGKIKYVYFIAETKGTNESTKLDSMEQAKIKCAEKLFEKLSNGEVHYGQVKDYKSLMDIVLDR